MSICVPGVLKDKADLQRGWGVEPRGADVSAKERLRRFYYVYNRSKVRWRCPPGGHYSTVVHASCRKGESICRPCGRGECPQIVFLRGVPLISWFPLSPLSRENFPKQ